MKPRARIVVAVLAVLVFALGEQVSRDLRAAPLPNQASEASLEFNRDVRPVLAQACFTCHGPSEATRQADLRLDTSDFIDRVVVPGDAEGSPLFQRLTIEGPLGR